MERIFTSILLTLVPLAFAQAPRVKVSFSPESEQYAQATREYQAVWDSEGQRIIEAMERIAGVQFPGDDIRATLLLDSGVLADQQLNERTKQRFASLSDVVHKLGSRFRRDTLLPQCLAASA